MERGIKMGKIKMSKKELVKMITELQNSLNECKDKYNKIVSLAKAEADVFKKLETNWAENNILCLINNNSLMKFPYVETNVGYDDFIKKIKNASAFSLYFKNKSPDWKDIDFRLVCSRELSEEFAGEHMALDAIINENKK